MAKRITRSGVTSVIAGCYICHAGSHWESRNAMMVAARHHDATGHPTWAEQVVSVRFGDTAADKTEGE